MAFPGILDLYEFCTTSYKEQLDVARKKLDGLNEEKARDEAKGKEKTDKTEKTAVNSTPEQVCLFRYDCCHVICLQSGEGSSAADVVMEDGNDGSHVDKAMTGDRPRRT